MECITTVYLSKADRSIDIMKKSNNNFSYYHIDKHGYEVYYKNLESLLLNVPEANLFLDDILQLTH
jgi:hypothetical protein